MKHVWNGVFCFFHWNGFESLMWPGGRYLGVRALSATLHMPQLNSSRPEKVNVQIGCEGCPGSV